MKRSIEDESGMWLLLAYVGGFAAARGITTIRHAGVPVWPFRETVTARGTHIHHGDWGMLALACASGASFVVAGHRRTFAVLVGAAAGVVVDETYQFMRKTVDPDDYNHPAAFACFGVGAAAIAAGVTVARWRRRQRDRRRPEGVSADRGARCQRCAPLSATTQIGKEQS